MRAMAAEEPMPVVELWHTPKRMGVLSSMLDMLTVVAKEPAPRPEVDLFCCRRRPTGKWHVHPVQPGEARQVVRQDADAVIVSVLRTSNQGCSLAFRTVATDRQNHSWDVVLCGSWRILSAPSFLNRYALDILSPEVPLSRQMIESWIAKQIRTAVKDSIQDAVKTHGSLDRVRERNVLPPRWWTPQLCAWLEDDGLSVVVQDVRWQSEEAERTEAERRQGMELEEFEQQRQRQRKVELRKMEEDATYEREKARIEAAQTVSQIERERNLQELELQHRRRLVELETEVQKAKQAAELAHWEFELRTAHLHHDIKAVEDATKTREDLEQRRKQTEELLATAMETLEKLAMLPEQMLAKLAEKDQTICFQTAERLVSQEFGFRLEDLGNLGYSGLRQALVRCASEKAIADGQPIRLTKTDLRHRLIRQFRVVSGQTRDVGAARVKGLPVGSLLQFDLVSNRPGFVTLLNIGTSGKVWLISPNAFVTAAEAKVASQRTSYTIPGPEFLPEDELSRCGLEFCEMGPGGWEHIVVFVSDEPLALMDILCRTSPDRPFAELSADELKELARQLVANRPETWSASALSFLVSEE